MHCFSLLVFCTFLSIAVMTNTSNERSSKGNTKLHDEGTYSKNGVIKSDTDAFKFLTRFGYNRCKHIEGRPKATGLAGLLCRSSMESMLTNFQTTFHLPITKKVDAATLNLMNTPRCGLPDSSSSSMDETKLW
jgi:hypothetical protein